MLPLFLRNLKSNYKVFVIFLSVMILYFSMIAGMFDPEAQGAMEELLKMLPQGMMDAFGFNADATTLTGFISTYFYGFLALVLPMVCTIIISYRLVGKAVDRGSMAYLLQTPHTRLEIILSQAGFLLLCSTVLFLVITIIGLVICPIMFDTSALNIKAFLLLNLGGWLVNLVMSGIGFFGSCLFNDGTKALAVSAGVPIGFFLLTMLSSVGEKFSWLKSITPFTLFDTAAIMTGETTQVAVEFLVLAGIAVALYFAGVLIFCKKDISV